MNEMIEKTIYSKKYPKKDYSSVINNLQDETDGEQDLKIDFDELYRKITEDGVYVSIPGRQKLKKSFVNQAIEISDMYELDIEITQKMV